MEFVLRKKYRWSSVVTVEIPGAGDTPAQEFAAEFVAVPSSILAEWTEEGTSDDEILSQVLVGWSGIVDEEGNPVPFSAETRDQVVGFSFIRAAIARQYFRDLAGLKRGN